MTCNDEKNQQRPLRKQWSCPLCTHTLDFPPESSKDIDFFVVHHFMQKHHLHPNDILAMNPSLEQALTEYSRGGF